MSEKGEEVINVVKESLPTPPVTTEITQEANPLPPTSLAATEAESKPAEEVPAPTVEVEHAEPLQIIKIGDENNGDSFELQEENLSRILSKIPPNMKVAVIAVVGAFRSGKSFLLNFFLRYLRSGNADDISQAWMFSEGEALTEGNLNEGDWSIVDAGETKRESSFAWRGGVERQTTGIWMWSEPFFRSTSASGGEKFAILLMDTQGMFDNETTMTLTAQIFGLSTLVSSFQIYNVEKKVQEDNLQHLALFSEYGRMALAPQAEQEAKKEELLAKTSTPAVPSPTEVIEKLKESATEDQGVFNDEEPSTEAKKEVASTPKKPSVSTKKPFQKLQFLIRDWQNFDLDYEEKEDSAEWFQTFVNGMDKYIQEVLREREHSDLQSTREQIVRCFEKLDCFMLPHPGNAVTKKTYDGSIRKIDASFRGLVNRYVRTIFDADLEPKEINHRQITAQELKTYFEVYSRMFQSGEKTFPKAMTMLDATAEANNRNAYDLGLQHYKVNMELLAGANKAFVKESELAEKSTQYHLTALSIFDEIATMGSPSVIAKHRQQLLDVIEQERTRYFQTNALRNPFKDMEYYILPIIIAFGAWLLAVITDKTCSTDFCENVEDTFVNIYSFIFFAIIVLTWKQISGGLKYLKEWAPVILEQVSKK